MSSVYMVLVMHDLRDTYCSRLVCQHNSISTVHEALKEHYRCVEEI